MLLILAATEFEMIPFLQLEKGNEKMRSLVIGVGPIETATRLMHYLTKYHKEIDGVVLFGIGGAYCKDGDEPGAALLEICLAESEVLGDVGICFEDRIEDLPQEFTGNLIFDLDGLLLSRTKQILEDNGIAPLIGAFVTVSGVSGSLQRGDILVNKFNGICENMEGAAAARVCQEFSIPLLEIRCISNLVEDRDVSKWKLEEAVQRAALMANIVVQELQKEL